MTPSLTVQILSGIGVLLGVEEDLPAGEVLAVEQLDPAGFAGLAAQAGAEKKCRQDDRDARFMMFLRG